MEKERSRNEDARVLYVAATRAVRRLHLVGVAWYDEDGSLASPRAASPLASLWPAVEADFLAATAASSALCVPLGTFVQDGELKDFVPQLTRLQAPAVPSAWHAPDVPLPAAETSDETAAPLALAVGTLTHAVLELIAADPEAWSAQRVTERQPGFERWLTSRGWSTADARSGAARAVAMLATTLASSDGQWVLHRRADAAAELALARVGAGGTAVTRVVDRCFVENGVRWIIDYKTVDLGAADNERLKAHAARYQAQLESYAELFADEGLPRRLAVFYVAHGILAGLEYNPAFE
jgi:ATP-dependent exoDNAse (exonuclease V) beta subunit